MSLGAGKRFLRMLVPPENSVRVGSTALTLLAGRQPLPQDLASQPVDGGEATGIIHLVPPFLKAFLAGRAALAAENLALRHPLAVQQRSVKRPKLRKRTRIFWSWLSRVWSGWKSALLVVQPDTVVRGHRQGFRPYGRTSLENRVGQLAAIDVFTVPTIWVVCITAIRERRRVGAATSAHRDDSTALRPVGDPVCLCPVCGPPRSSAEPRSHHQVTVPRQLPGHDQPG